MGEDQLQFRTAAFGGFQKQDVLAYLETSAREQHEKLSALQRELEEMKTAKEAGEAALAARERDLREKEKALAAREEELEKLKQEKEELSDRLKDREDELDGQLARIRELEGQVEQLSAQVKKLTPAASAYEGLKDRTAGIELEAHSRAQEIEREAEQRTRKTRAELEGWFAKLQAAYDRLRSDLDASLARTGEELSRVEQGLNGISAEFDAQGSALTELRKEVEGVTGPKAPTPLPLEEGQ
ncbi:MAG: hypothetical protein PUC36_08615 [Clostridiales bacterium]|nr:hypothetical protein [Clostridiales bacterium]